MTKTIAILSTLLLAFWTAPAWAQHDHAAHAAQAKPLPAAAKPVLDQYLKITAALAADTLDGVSDAAQAIAKSLAGDLNKTLPAAIGTHAEALGKAKDLKAARVAFKELSTALVRYLGSERIRTGQYHVVYCDMAKGHWLQTNKAIKNPYHGKEMLACGQILATF